MGILTPILAVKSEISTLRFTAIDPDGNIVELTEMSERWYKYLEERRSKGLDALGQWKSKTAAPRVGPR